jgi:RNA recognition motif-containing protein
MLHFFTYFIFILMNIFVAKLNYETHEEDLRELFEQYGEVDSVKIIMDRDTGKSKGYGFVEMPNSDEGNEAIENLNEVELDGRTIVVKEARPKEDRRGGGGRNRGGGGYNKGGGGYNRGGGGYRDNNSW